jgi:imidazolonepropionase-like amidohydrolase
MRTAVLIVAVFAATMTALAQAPAPGERPTVILAGAVLDPRTGEIKRDQMIVVRGNRIEAMRPAAEQNAPLQSTGAKIVDLSKFVVLPGMIDTHTHVFLQAYKPDDYDTQLLKHSMAYRSARAVVAARRALEQGFTTIRDLETEGAGYGDVGIKKAIEDGHIPGPRMFVVTRAISTTGGYPLHDYSPEVEVPKGVQIVDGPIEARKAAREQMENGADWIKVYMTHRSWLDAQGNLVTQATLTPEEIRAIVDETHGWHRKTACHAYNGEGLQRALDGGCDSIEHGLELSDANIAQMVKQGTWYVPTMAVYYEDNAPPDTEAGKRDRKRIELHGPSLRKAIKGGVKIAYGTDIGGYAWSKSEAKEFEYLVEFGMTPLLAIQTATIRAAELLGMQGKLGVIAPGAFADIIAVAGDPSKDVKVLQNVQFVMKDGTVYRQPETAK